MNLIRHLEFFDPLDLKTPVHIIGLGAVGSHIAIFLTRLGISNFTLWDFDTVGDHNIPNQHFEEKHIGQRKVDAISKQMLEINPDIKITKKDKYNPETIINGHVFMCVDDIELRHQFYLTHEFEIALMSVFDTRIALEVGQLFSAKWNNNEHKELLISNSAFTNSEVEEEVSACGSKLAVLPTIVMIANIAVINFMNLIKTNELKPFMTFNTFNLTFSKPHK